MNMEYKTYRDPEKLSTAQWEALLNTETTNYFQTPEIINFLNQAKIEWSFVAVEREDKIRASVIVMIQKEKGLKAKLSTRGIIYGGPIIDTTANDEDVFMLLDTLNKSLKNKVIYIETRNLNSYERYIDSFKRAGFDYVKHLNFHLDSTEEQAMKKRMSSSKLRQIKKSIKSGATIIEATEVSQIKSYYAILKNLYATRIKKPLPSIDFFISLFHQKNVKFFLIIYDDEVIGGIVCPILPQKVIYEWFVCGKDGVYKNIYPSILATWAAMDYAIKNEIPRFDFMGAGKPDEDYGVREFKSKFGGELVQHGRFLHVAQPLLYTVGKTAVKILKKS